MDINQKWPTKIAIFMVSISALFYLYEFFIRVSTSVLIEPMMMHFKANATAFGTMSACFFWGYMPMQIPAGLLGDRFGPKRILIGAVLLCSLATLWFAQTQAIHWAAFARFLMGFAASFAYIGPLMIAARWLQPKWFASASGCIQMLGCMGAILGGSPVALVAEVAGWQQAYQWVALFGIGLAILLGALLKDQPPAHHHQEAPSNAQKADYLSLLKNRQILYTAFIGFTLWAPMSVFAELWGIPFLMQAKGIGNIEAAGFIRWVWLGVAIGGPLMGWLSEYIKSRKCPILIALALAVIIDFTLIYMHPQSNALLSDVLLFLFGLSAATQCVTFGLVRDLHSLETVGAGIGLNNMAVILGGTLLQPLSGWILERFWDGSWQHHIHSYSLHGYQVAFVMLPILSLLGLACTLYGLQETHCQHRSKHA